MDIMVKPNLWKKATNQHYTRYDVRHVVLHVPGDLVHGLFPVEALQSPVPEHLLHRPDDVRGPVADLNAEVEVVDVHELGLKEQVLASQAKAFHIKY